MLSRVEQNHFSRRCAVQEHDGMELARFISEEDVDPNPITLVSTQNAKVAQCEDEFEIRRRSFFGAKNDNPGQWENKPRA
jgi:hypothetical protein